MRDPDEFVETTSAHPARLYTDAVRELFTSTAVGTRQQVLAARQQLHRVMLDTVAFGEIAGAMSVLQGVASFAQEVNMRGSRRGLLTFANEPMQTLLPRVDFTEALEDMVQRTPATIRRASERTAERIAQLYSNKHVVAFAYSAEASVTKAAQRFIADALRSGINEGEAGRRLAMAANTVRKRSKEWTEAYARMSFRTNVNTAVSAGRFRQAQDPDIKAVAPAFKFGTAGDVDVRSPNHSAAHGVVMRVDNPEWRRIAPPLDYNCRCRLMLMSVPQLMRAGKFRDGQVIDDRVPSQAGPAANFRHGGRPDLWLNGAVR